MDELRSIVKVTVAAVFGIAILKLIATRYTIPGFSDVMAIV